MSHKPQIGPRETVLLGDHSMTANILHVKCFRYQILAPTAVSGGFVDGKKACEKLLDAMQLEKASYRVGTSKVLIVHVTEVHEVCIRPS